MPDLRRLKQRDAECRGGIRHLSSGVTCASVGETLGKSNDGFLIGGLQTAWVT